ncbi:MAG TPA: DUF6624 domain-containing protein [Gemmatimonadales bacterium]|nr:DUF6624 domain-containing protein [Gemmatimonadales bacterium]
MKLPARVHSMCCGRWGCPLPLRAVLTLLLLAPVGCQPRTPWDAAGKAELLQRATADQALRDTVFSHFRNGGHGPDSALIMHLRAQDSTNGEWLKATVRQRGWPGIAAVGPEEAGAAFLLVQHDRTDTAFQSAALGMIEAAYRKHDADGQALALLTDELLLDRGKPQRYGTKARIAGGALVFDSIADSAHVDERRAKLGLQPLQAYATFLDSLYGLHFRSTATHS